MTKKIKDENIVIIHQAPTGRYYITRADVQYLSEEDQGYRTRAEAKRAALAVPHWEITHYMDNRGRTRKI